MIKSLLDAGVVAWLCGVALGTYCGWHWRKEVDHKRRWRLYSAQRARLDKERNQHSERILWEEHDKWEKEEG